MLREIDASLITERIAALCIRANTALPADIRARLEAARKDEPWDNAASVLDTIKKNYETAEEQQMPICQDTGAACVFLEIGQDVHINGDLTEAVNKGVAAGYMQGYLRKSMVKDPLRRENTGNNTPAMLTVDLVSGNKIRLTVAPKGFGSENMSAIRMLKPSDGIKGVIGFVLETVQKAGSNPCPPVVVGVGIGGTFDKCALLAKKALLRPLDEPHPDPFYRDLEESLLQKINALGIGPQGFGGKTTALGVSILTMPTHIAGLPVAVNISCHVTRHITEVI